MAWIKMRTELARDPAVSSISAECGIPKTHVVGCLHAVWSWFDEQSHDGVIRIPISERRLRDARVTLAEISSVTGVDGFAAAMIKAGWLLVSDLADGEMISIPNWDRHNSQSAKRRALTAARNQRSRRQARDATVTLGASPEKRREEKRRDTSFPPTPPSLCADKNEQPMKQAIRRFFANDVGDGGLVPFAPEGGRIIPDAGLAEPDSGYWSLDDEGRRRIDAALGRLAASRPYRLRSPAQQRVLDDALDDCGFSAVIEGLEWAASAGDGACNLKAAMAHAKTAAAHAGFEAACGRQTPPADIAAQTQRLIEASEGRR